MKRIRKGNDINLIWEIYGEIDGIKSPYDLSGKKLSLYMSTLYGKEEVKDFTTEENMVIWSFRGKDQKHLGVYTLTLVENEADNFMHTVDECKAFEIVSHSCITDADGEDIRITTELNIGAITPDTSLNPDSLNVVTNAAICAALDAFREEVNARVIAFEEATGSDLAAYKEQLNASFETFQSDIEARLSSAAEDNATFKADLESAFDTFKESVSSEITTALQEQNDYIAREVQNQNEEISKGFTQQNNKIAEEFAQQDAEIAKKVSYDGKYPSLTSGFANNLVGRGESTESEFTFRASGGKSIEDGAARISELRGNGVVWNQIAGEIESGVGYGTMTGIEYFSRNGKCVIKNNSCETPDTMNMRKLDGCIPIAGHKYLGIIDKYSEYLCFNDGYVWDFRAGEIVTAPSGVKGHTQMLRIRIPIPLEVLPIGGEIETYVRLIDLTLMFGAGNEPTTIEEFYARKPIGVDEYAYNEGTLIPFNADAIKSVGFNAWDEEWELGSFDDSTHKWIADTTRIKTKNFIRILPNTKYHLTNPMGTASRYVFYDENQNYLSFVGANSNSDFTTPSGAHYMLFGFAAAYGATYNNDVCINLVHTGYRNGEYQPYEDFIRLIDPRIKDAFPNGMKPWDKVYNKNGKGYIVKGTGVVDLGTLDYVASDHNRLYSTGLKNTLKPTNDIINAISSRLTAATASDAYNNTQDKIMCTNANAVFTVYDSAYVDNPSGFKTAMQGVMLWYELAEPEVIEYDEPFNLDYEVWDFGTEEILSEQPSAPISADIIYQFNAVDTIRNNQIEIAELKAMIATMQAQMASLTDKE